MFFFSKCLDNLWASLSLLCIVSWGFCFWGYVGWGVKLTSVSASRMNEWLYMYVYIYLCVCVFVGHDSSVRIAARYGLDGPGIES
jgi:hypothetical protein